MPLRPQLIVHTVWFPLDPSVEGTQVRADDPERAEAVRLGRDLYDLLTRPLEEPQAHGPGVPVRVGTRFDLVDPEEAEEVVLVVVLGPRSHDLEVVRQRAIARIEQWSQLTSCHLVLVPTSDKWRASSSALPIEVLPTNLYGQGDLRRGTLDQILLALSRVLGMGRQRLFISYALADLPSTGGAAELIHQHVANDTTGRAFFSVSLQDGEEVAAGDHGEAPRGIFVVVRGDAYSSRARCQRQLLRAKLARVPTVTVEVLSRGERRSLAYGGNGPTMVWAQDSELAPALVVRLAMVEGVRAALFEAEASRLRELTRLPEDVVVMPRPPELLDLAGLRRQHTGALVVLHPEPELSVFEREVLHDADPRLRLVTPTTAFSSSLGSSIRSPLAGWQVAMSLSDSPDVDGPEGTTQDHVHDVTTTLARSLISAGAAIANGGDFRVGGFTTLLVRLISTYNQTASSQADFLHSYLGAPLSPDDGAGLAFTAHHLGAFGSKEQEALLPPPEGGWPAPARAALYFSDMRRVMAQHTHARILLGGGAVPKNPEGDRKGYGGRYPGVVEEAWRALQVGKPLYILGGFGGAAELVMQLLLSDATPERMQEQTWAGEAWFSELTAALDTDPDVQRLGLPPTMEALASAVRTLGRPLLASDEASLAWNGLNIEENHTLFGARDPFVIASLVMRGLLRVAAHQKQGKVQIELVHGRLEDASGLDVLVVPAFSDLELGGAGGALDRATGGGATRARDRSVPLAIPDARLDADYVYVANLGRLSEATADPAAAVRAAAAETAEVVQRHGFARLGVVTFLGNVADTLEEVVTPLVDALGTTPDDTEVLWFEEDGARFFALSKLLGSMEDVELTDRRQVLPAAPRRAGREHTVLHIRDEGDSLDVSLLLQRGNGLAPSSRSELAAERRRSFAGRSTDPAPGAEQLGSLGEHVAVLLLGQSAGAVLSSACDTQLVVSHDAGASSIPYEAMRVVVEGEEIVPALRGGVVRRLRVEAPLSAGILAAPRRHLSVLLVVDPTDDLTGAASEGDMVRGQLEAMGLHFTELRGPAATRARVREGLGTHDVLHYCGHAGFAATGDRASGLVCADGNLTLEVLRGLAGVPRFAFVNACQSGRFRDEVGAEINAQAFAEYFLRAGVEAYLGTFWKLSDSGAELFAGVVYAELAAGEELGVAILHGRQALAHAGNSDWANYLLYGHDRFRLAVSRARPGP